MWPKLAPHLCSKSPSPSWHDCFDWSCSVGARGAPQFRVAEQKLDFLISRLSRLPDLCQRHSKGPNTFPCCGCHSGEDESFHPPVHCSTGPHLTQKINNSSTAPIAKPGTNGRLVIWRGDCRSNEPFTRNSAYLLFQKAYIWYDNHQQFPSSEVLQADTMAILCGSSSEFPCCSHVPSRCCRQVRWWARWQFPIDHVGRVQCPIPLHN
ncbi:hypothetical protein B0T20DRAFT_231563 [Sordaria brevicollis]|uniref:Uncharacterized protein n=1 Tax=Sordaria brevicollis TaxID=83679 RepID=A0AAE0UBB4_SORBR|nr:hypothetical protein B0T20DRAFT_231563 [Sordaria brevicollis]